MSGFRPSDALWDLENAVSSLDRATNSLTYVATGGGWDTISAYRHTIERARCAARDLQHWIRDGSHGCQRCRDRVVAEAPDLPPESCTCSAVRHPPCGFCEGSCECSVCGEFFYAPDNTRELPVCLQCDEAAA